jgi:hypothetical protein
LFRREDWLRLLNDAGFQALSVPFEHSELDPGTHEIFVATKPASPPRVLLAEQEQQQQQ